MNIMENIWIIAAIWMGLAFIASIISIRLGISVALIEIFIGVIAGNFLGINNTTQWIDFLAMLGSGVLTFLAGAEIDPVSLKANIKMSSIIGILSFLIPFLTIWMITQYVFGWSMKQAQIAGIALSTTSVAVVYAVMIESRLGETSMGKMILAACFITDFGTVFALSILFADYNIWMLIFLVILCVMLWFMPKWTKYLIGHMGTNKVSQPEVKFILLVLFFLGGLATTAKSEAVLPAYLIGLVVAGGFIRDKTLVDKMRTIAFTIFTPFYFLKAGLYVSLSVIWFSFGIISIFLLIKMVTKAIGVYPFSRMFQMRKKEATYTTLLMATGLTFGTISALFGLNNHIIDQKQYTILVTTIILSAFIPTLIAQKYFQPTVNTMIAWGRLRKSTEISKDKTKRRK
jgi:Kef-type K+ transport system membrane component KefB